MGTRHLIAVMIDKEYKLASYGQWDGYPSGQGAAILDFLKNRMDRPLFEARLREASFLTEEENDNRWEEAGAEPGLSLVSLDISEAHEKLYPENNRNTGAQILDIIQDSEKAIKTINSIDFAGDSLFCEWAYVVDLDKNTFEIYEGFNTDPLEETERFYGFESDERYYPVKHLKTFSLQDLPSEQVLSDELMEDQQA